MNLFGGIISNESKEDINRRIKRDKFIWNEAIEACYKIAYDNKDYCTYTKIRKLKKDVTD